MSRVDPSLGPIYTHPARAGSPVDTVAVVVVAAVAAVLTAA